MIEQCILGMIQGVAEWLPVSSEGAIVLVKTHFFDSGVSFETLIRNALFLHFGTFLAALVYFRGEVLRLLKALFRYHEASEEMRYTLRFLIVSTAVSGMLGMFLIKVVIDFSQYVSIGSRYITAAIGMLLLITALLQILAQKSGCKSISDMRMADSILLGIAQGFAVLPGLSRSGLTVSTLLLRKYDKTLSLKLSFLMSLPVVFLGNVILNLSFFTFDSVMIVGLLSSFLFGLLTIHVLIRLSQRINFGYFVLIFALVTFMALL